MMVKNEQHDAVMSQFKVNVREYIHHVWEGEHIPDIVEFAFELGREEKGKEIYHWLKSQRHGVSPHIVEDFEDKFIEGGE